MRLSRRLLAPLLLALSLFVHPALATELRGLVVGVHDGDTLTLLTPEKQQVKVRLAEIDTPESRQPYGTRARQALADLAFRQQVRVVVVDTDRYGRTVGRVFVGATDVNAALVRQGAAWVYRQYAHDPALRVLEQAARNDRRGLWALPEAERVPPWEWRRQRRHQ
ncbi:MAG TPA: thermonuclease family protein [Geminicoccus sp.]|uniref:thermonuclease family protein n=1 Tax=Geminicoccus sp. TaxID=2024832 RepID=UPI002CF1A0B6|nr:thermonuclease family protein [Geminicoccus sp.]HWL69449.1 thermonuclease family protein [Geminicoccus sp.]